MTLAKRGNIGLLSNYVPALAVSVSFCVMCGCGRQPTRDDAMTEPMTPPVITMLRTDTPLTVQAPQWEGMAVYPMALNQPETAAGAKLHEPGEARFAFDDQAIYLHVRFHDRDVATLATQNDEGIYKYGDLAEWFIGTPPGPEGEPGVYLEMHAAPNGECRAYRVQRPGVNERLTPIPFKIEIAIDGSLNRRSDTDRAWSAQFTLPWAVLEALDPNVTDRAALKRSLSTLVGRYNYGRHLLYGKDGAAGPEMTMWPPQPRTRFHLRPFHAPISFEDE